MTAPDVSGLAWLRGHLLDQILPHWLEASPTERGLFIPHVDRRWQRTEKTYGTIVSQSRLLYNFACGYRLTGDRAYADAVERGARFVLDHFRDATFGGWYWSCDQSGAAVDKSKSSYGHAFAMFGLAHAYAVTKDPALRAAIDDTWRTVLARLRDRHGGLILTTSEEFYRSEPERSQNPIMHLFEACLAAFECAEMPEMLDHAADIFSFVQHRLLRPDGRLPEVYTTEWQPLPRDQGGRIDVGHAFEWAYLLSRAELLGLAPDPLPQARRFLETGVAFGVDYQDGGVVSPAGYDGDTTGATKGWWEQCEAARACMHFAYRRGMPEITRPLDAILTFVKKSLIDPEYGGWFSVPSPTPGSVGEHKGSEWKIDYHVVGMCMEAIDLVQSAAVSVEPEVPRA